MKRLHSAIKTNTLEYFFIPSINLMEGLKEDIDLQTRLEEKVKEICNNLNQYLENISVNHAIKFYEKINYICKQVADGLTSILSDEVPDGEELNPVLRRFDVLCIDDSMIWNLCKPTKNFSGRMDDVNIIHEKLLNGQVVSICGLGGSGKTETAVAYCHRKGTAYDVIAWFNAETEYSLLESLQEFARYAKVGFENKESIEKLIKKLTAHFRDQNTLFVIDNMDNEGMVSRWCTRILDGRQSQVRFLMTSQLRTWSTNVYQHMLGALTEAEAVDLVKMSIKQTLFEIESCKKIIKMLEHLPLAIQVAISYIQKNNVTTSSYSDVIDNSQNREIRAKEFDPRVGKSVKSSFTLTINHLKGSQSSNLEFAGMLAFMDGKLLEIDVLKELALEVQSGFCADSALSTLSGYSILQIKDGKKSYYTMHGLLQETLKEELENNYSRSKLKISVPVEYISKNISAINRYRKKHHNPDHISYGERWIHHIIHIHQQYHNDIDVMNVLNELLYHVIETLVKQGKYNMAHDIIQLRLTFEQENGISTTTTKFWLARCHQKNGHYNEAIEIYNKIYESRKITLGVYHADSMETQHNIAGCYLRKSKYDQALVIYHENYYARKNNLGELHPQTLKTYHNIACCLIRKSKYAEALETSRCVFDARKLVLGYHHLDTLKTYQLIGSCLFHTNESREALELYKEIYETLKGMVGEEHQSTVDVFHDMALCLSDLGENQEAVRMYRRYHDIQKTNVGENHPYTLIGYSSLADTLEQIGEREEAIKIYREVYQMKKDTLGADHENTLATYYNLAYALGQIGEREEAIKIYREVYQMEKDTLGADHTSTLLTYYNLADTLGQIGEREEAIKIYREVYQMRKDTLGADHEDTLTTYNNLAYTLGQIGEREEAIKIYREVYQIEKSTLGADHTNTLQTYYNLAYTFGQIGEREEAIKIYREVYQMRKDTLGADHEDTLTTYNNLAYTLGQIDQREEAIKIYREMYQMRKDTLGADHKDTLATYNNLAHTLGQIGERQEVIKIYREVYQMQKDTLGADHKDTLATYNNLAYTLGQIGEREEAIKIYREIYQMMSDTLGSDHERTF